MIGVKGRIIDKETRCVHYMEKKDIIAIKFYCCDTYYPCYKCHEIDAGHSIQPWPRDAFDQKAILCGVCKTEQTIESYMNTNTCPTCSSAFNENCRNHHAIYFDV